MEHMELMDIQRMVALTNNSIYDLVVLASRRALELAEGQPKLIKIASNLKPSVVALAEIAAGRVILGK